MSIELALLIVAVVSIVGNRVLSILVGLILRVPAHWLLPTLYLLDMVQIPLFFWLYANSATVINRLPASLRGWFSKDWTASGVGRWTSSLGSLGVFTVSALPMLGGGMWSAVFLAYGLRLHRGWSCFLMALGSLLSYLSLYWVLDTLVRTVRYFSVR